MLKIYNTLSGQKEIFKPLKPKRVRMYACGVTVYDYSHLGHARSALVFDVIRNYLRFSGYAAKYVRNFTDIDDKIINRASKEGIHWKKIAEKYLKAYRQDMACLGVIKANKEPRATKHISDIKDLIKTLVKKGHAYQVDGDVYYEVSTFPQYGRLSKRKAEDLLTGARVEVDERKRNPMDFALWKSSKPGEPKWPSPWGPGRPGWHIECSAMSMKHLGKTFDIHGGGMDLIFPHHENEIAQSCAATGKEFARYWIHNGFVQINQEKMSKSLGNFFTIQEVFEKWGYGNQVTAETLRYFLLATHYRSPLDFSDRGLQETKRALDGFYGLFQRLEEPSEADGPGDLQLRDAIERLGNSFREEMDDDFNTPAAIAEFQRLRGETNKLLEIGLSKRACQKAHDAFQKYGGVLRLFQQSWRDWEFRDLYLPAGWADQTAQRAQQVVIQHHDEAKKWHPAYSGGIKPQFTAAVIAYIEQKMAERNEARQKNDFAKADEIRKALAGEGIIIEDLPDGTSRWKR
ncbi:MAG: cysteine--tRNA ligase [Nitrospiraceae bacterium]